VFEIQSGLPSSGLGLTVPCMWLVWITMILVLRSVVLDWQHEVMVTEQCLISFHHKKGDCFPHSTNSPITP